MKYILFVILLLPAKLVSAQATSGGSFDESIDIRSMFIASPYVGYSYANVFGPPEVPTLMGLSYGFDIEYVIGTSDFALAPFGSYRSQSLENTHNNSLIKETWEGSYQGVGLKAYTRNMFLRAALGTGKFENKVKSNDPSNTKLKSEYKELGGGIYYRINRMSRVTLGLDLTHFKFSPNDQDISRRIDYISYTIYAGFSFIIPSSRDRK